MSGEDNRGQKNQNLDVDHSDRKTALGQPQEDVKNRPDVSIVKPKDYPKGLHDH